MFPVRGGLLVERLGSSSRLAFFVQVWNAKMVVSFAPIPTAFEAIVRVHGVPAPAAVSSSVSIAGFGDVSEPPEKDEKVEIVNFQLSSITCAYDQKTFS